MFRSLPGGIGELLAALIAALPDDALRPGCPVKTLSGPSPWTLTLASGETVTARDVVLTVPAHVASGIVATVDPRLSELCAGIPYTSTATVALAYPASAVGMPLVGTGFVVPRVERELTVMAGSWVSSKWPNRAPSDHVLLRGFLGGARDPHVLDRSDDELIQLVHDDFNRLVGLSAQPVLARVYRWPRANPQHEVGHAARLRMIESRLADLPGLHLTGAAYRGVGIPDCIASGRATARQVADRIRSI